MKNEVKVVLANYDHSRRYMTVRDGLNLKGKCLNKDCIAYEKPVWISKGYGTFNIAKERFFNKCTCCNQKINSDTIKSLGYMMCKITLEGGKADTSEEECFSEVKEERTGIFVKFRDYDEDILRWDFLEAKVEMIE